MSRTTSPAAGNPRSPHAPLDPRLLRRGLALAVTDLVAVWIAHEPVETRKCQTCGSTTTQSTPSFRN